VLVSGGLDSAVLLAEAMREGPVAPVFVRSGLVWEPAEMYWLERFLQTIGAPPLVVLDVPVGDLYGAHWSLTGDEPPGAESPDEAVYLPGRNLLPDVSGRVGGGRRLRRDRHGSLARQFPDGTRSSTRWLAIGLAMGREGALPIGPLAGLIAEVVPARAGFRRLTFALAPTPDTATAGVQQVRGAEGLSRGRRRRPKVRLRLARAQARDSASRPPLRAPPSRSSSRPASSASRSSGCRPLFQHDRRPGVHTPRAAIDEDVATSVRSVRDQLAGSGTPPRSGAAPASSRPARRAVEGQDPAVGGEPAGGSGA
jgi:7-cyano-7-deazaguanine synthase